MVYYRSFYSLDHSGDKTRLAWGQARPLMSAGWRERSPGEQEAGMTASSFLRHGHSCSLQTRVVSALALLGCSLSLRSVCFYSPPSPPACRQNPWSPPNSLPAAAPALSPAPRRAACLLHSCTSLRSPASSGPLKHTPNSSSHSRVSSCPHTTTCSFLVLPSHKTNIYLPPQT